MQTHTTNGHVPIPRQRRRHGLALMCILCTASLFGLQTVWTFELSYGTPYLLSKGVSKSWMGIVWLAGPLSGLIMQPLVGRWSDHAGVAHGSHQPRRRPFLIGGCVCCLISLWLIAFSGSSTVTAVDLALILIGFYALDCALNVQQCAGRALMVDVLPIDAQAVGSSWASFMIGLGNIVGYGLGWMDLRVMFPDEWKWNQVQSLAVVCGLLMVLGTLVTCVGVGDPIPVDRNHGVSTPNTGPEQSSSSSPSSEASTVPSGIIQEMWTVLRVLPTSVHRIFWAQFFAWFGWFPFLFFSSEYIKEWSPADTETDAVRDASRVLMLFSLVFMLCSMIWPRLGTCLNIGLNRIWFVSQLLFAVLMVIGWWARAYWQACVVVVAVGVCYSVTIVVPFALLGQYIQSRSDAEQATPVSPLATHGDKSRGAFMRWLSTKWHPYHAVTTTTHVDSNDESENNAAITTLPTTITTTHQLDNHQLDIHQTCPSNIPTQINHHNHAPDFAAGTILGLHNIYVVAPQFLASLLSSLIFHYGQWLSVSPVESTRETGSVAVVWLMGAITSLISAGIIAQSL